MPGQPGTDKRRRGHVVNSRWSDAEFAELEAIAEYAGLKKTEILRRLVRTAGGNIVASRDLTAAVNSVCVNTKRLSQRLDSNLTVSTTEIDELSATMRAAVGKML